MKKLSGELRVRSRADAKKLQRKSFRSSWILRFSRCLVSIKKISCSSSFIDRFSFFVQTDRLKFIACRELPSFFILSPANRALSWQKSLRGRKQIGRDATQKPQKFHFAMINEQRRDFVEICRRGLRGCWTGLIALSAETTSTICPRELALTRNSAAISRNLLFVIKRQTRSFLLKMIQSRN